MTKFFKYKKTFAILIAILTILTITSVFIQNKKPTMVKGPELIKGRVDLTSWDFHRTGGAYLEGEWEIYNGVFLSPEKLHKLDTLKKSFIDIVLKKSEIPSLPNISNKPITLRAVIRVKPHELLTLNVVDNGEYLSRIWVNGQYMTEDKLSDSRLLVKAGFRDQKVKDQEKTWNVAGADSNADSYQEIEVIIQTTSAAAHDYILLGIDDMNNKMKSEAASNVINTGLLGALIIMGIYHVIFFFIRKSDTALLYIGMICASMTCLLALNYFDSNIANYFNLQYSIQSCFVLKCLIIAVILLSGGAFTNTLYNNEAFPRIYKMLCITLIIWSFATVAISLVTDIKEWMALYQYGYFFIVLFVGYYCIVVARAFRRKKEGAGIFLASYIFTAIVALHDILTDYRIIHDSQYYYYYGLICIILSMAIIMAKRYTSLFIEQARSAAELSASHDAMKKKNIELQSMWQEVTSSRNELASLNSNLESVVQRRTSTIRNLLDNAGQGFLSFDSSLVIEEDYSTECEKIFGCSLRNKSFIDLIDQYDSQEKSTIEQILNKILQHDHKRNAYLSLLPQQIQVQEKLIQLEYKPISDSMSASGVKMMVVLTDITEKHALEKALELKRKHLEMVVKVVVHQKDFHECIQDYAGFCINEYNEIMASQLSNAEKRIHILRKVHTMKGNFAQFELGGLLDRLHQLEDMIIEFNGAEVEMADFKKLINVSEMMEWLNLEVKNLEDILGKGYVSRSNVVTIEIKKLIEIENRIKEMFPENQGRILLKELKTLRYRSLREMLEPYVDYSQRMAERLQKNISMELSVAEDIMIDSEKYHDLFKSLVHVFRNAVDHGIEDEDERIENGKSEIGHINCNAYFSADKRMLVMEIRDDGKGINSEIIKEKALQLGLITEEEASEMDEQSILRLILKDSFSTSQETSLISGRGVGLSATAAEIQKLTGNIEIQTKLGEGTRFIFSVPNE